MLRILCASVKGGVGKTTCAVGLARAFERKGLRVGLLDLDYRNPECPLFLGDETQGLERGPGDVLIPPVIQGIHVFSMAFIWPPGQSVLVEDAQAVKDIEHLLLPGIIAWPELDVMVIDSAPTSSGVTVAAISEKADWKLDGVVAVSHPSSASKAALLRTLNLFLEKQVPVYALVSNQGVDEDGRNRFDLNDEALGQLARDRNIPIFHAIPHTRDLDGHFDILAGAIQHAAPVFLKKVEIGTEKWLKLSNLARRFGA